MDASREKVLLLYRQRRYELAERELGSQLAAEPGDSWAHAMLALCLSARGKLEEADAAARAAIEADPDADFPHHARAVVLIRRRRLKDARDAMLEAIRLAPQDADHHALLAAIQLDLDRPQDALASADTALSLDPRDTRALNARAKALLRVGRADEARDVATRSLAIDADEGDTHETLGAAMLYAGDSEAALARYREALRLDPTSASAREGFLTALKARHRIYRVVLAFLLWMGRQRSGVRWAVVIALIGGRKILEHVTRDVPALAPLTIPLIVLLVGFLLLTWTADPLFNLLVRLDPVGRHALSARERATSNYLVAFACAILIVVVTALVAPGDGARVLYVGAAALIGLPLSLLAAYPSGRSRRRLALYTVVLAMLGTVAVAITATREAGQAPPTGAVTTALLYGIGCLLCVGIASRPHDDKTAETPS